MAKIIVVPNAINDIDEVLISADAILLGINNLSVNYTDIGVEEIESIVNKIKLARKEVFVSLNKNMHNQDLKSLEEILIKCDELKVDGIFYYDVAVLTICHRLCLDLQLVWSAEHMVTNLYTIKYWQDFNIRAAFLSNELTLDEIIDIKNNVDIPIIVQSFGYLPMYVSKRLAIRNYLNYFKLKTNSKRFCLWKEEKQYPIIERDIGTEIYSDYILNAIFEYLIYDQNKIEYVLLSGIHIEKDKFITVIDMFKSVNEETQEEYKKEIENMFPNTGQGFLHTETIYQVKKNDK